MANMCDSLFRFYSENPETLDKFYELLTRLEKEKDNGMWVGHIVNELGGNDSLYVRGWWDDLKREENSVSFHQESAWEPLIEARDWICEKFEDLSFGFIAEEPGMTLFEKRIGLDGDFSGENYMVHMCFENEYFTEYFDDIDSALHYIEKIAKAVIKSEEDIIALNSSWESSDDFVYLNEFVEV